MKTTDTSAAIPKGLGLGCWQLSGTPGGTASREASRDQVRAAYDLGLRHFDTAQGYGDGASESVLGEALRGLEGVFVATKTGTGERQEVLDRIEQSRSRLDRDCIDLIYIHWPRKGQDPRPTVEALETARSRGRIRLIGVSNFSVSDMVAASRAGRIDAHQLCYNLLWRYPERDVIPWCRENGVALVTYSTIAQGLLSDTPRSPEGFQKGDPRAATLYYRPDVWPHVREAVVAMRAQAAGAGRKLASAAMRWVLEMPGVHAALVGARDVEQVRRNVEAAATPLGDQLARELTRLSMEAMTHIPDVGNIFLYYP